LGSDQLSPSLKLGSELFCLRLRLNTKILRGKQGSPLGAGGFVVFLDFSLSQTKKQQREKIQNKQKNCSVSLQIFCTSGRSIYYHINRFSIKYFIKNGYGTKLGSEFIKSTIKITFEGGFAVDADFSDAFSGSIEGPKIIKIR
jgi:hypothetical protein